MAVDLITAIRRNSSSAAIAAIASGEDVNASKDGKAAIIFACEGGNEKIVGAMIDAGVCLAPEGGESPWAVASKSGDPGVLKLLADAGVAEVADGETAEAPRPTMRALASERSVGRSE